ncbi:MAG: MaoC family dehydratase N-terminal domain-containing protein [Deltaproteobacteria bacterium]|nr:MaoC family dehydratase N-terminal domain-containing protein [Deltaproteobacteria bacterium]
MNQKYFEDLQLGDQDQTAGRTITEADIVNFAGLSGDFNPIHMDQVFAEKTFFKKRIAHGILVFSIASGLFTQCEMNTFMKKSVIALMEIKWKFLKPVFIGDTIHLEVEIIEKKKTSKPDRGIVLVKRTVLNQDGDAVQEGDVIMMIKRKPE